MRVRAVHESPVYPRRQGAYSFFFEMSATSRALLSGARPCINNFRARCSAKIPNSISISLVRRWLHLKDTEGCPPDNSERSDWVGRAGFLLRPVHERLLTVLKASGKLFADETTAPVLDPGRGRTKIGQLWAYARDDRPWGGTDPPGVAYVYAPDRKATQPIAHLSGFTGILQVDGYAGYRGRNDVQLAFCWSHVRRRFYELAAAGPAPIATEALERIAKLYAVEKDIRGRNADERRAVRQDRSRPIIDGLEPWLRVKLALISQKTKLAEAIRYALSRWNGLTHFLDDGRIEIDSNVVERSIRPIALNRKNALFAGSDGGAEHWAVVASLIESCKLNAIDPQAYLTDVTQASSLSPYPLTWWRGSGTRRRQQRCGAAADFGNAVRRRRWSWRMDVGLAGRGATELRGQFPDRRCAQRLRRRSALTLMVPSRARARGRGGADSRALDRCSCAGDFFFDFLF